MEKRVQDYTQDILAVVRSNTSPAAMSDKLGDFHANDIADAMPRLTVPYSGPEYAVRYF